MCILDFWKAHCIVNVVVHKLIAMDALSQAVLHVVCTNILFRSIQAHTPISFSMTLKLVMNTVHLFYLYLFSSTISIFSNVQPMFTQYNAIKQNPAL